MNQITALLVLNQALKPFCYNILCNYTGDSITNIFFYQMKGILKNKTQIEDWICDKARDRRKRNKDLKPFDYPYDLGWKKNLLQVLLSN